MTKAKWIWKNKEFTSDEYAVFCDEFDFSGNSCSIDISVCGDYVLFVNGNFAAFNQYADSKHYKVLTELI